MRQDRSSTPSLLELPDPWAWLSSAEQAKFDPVDAALLVARDEYPQLDWRAYRAQLDAIGRYAVDAVGAPADPIERVRGLNRVLFEHQGFAGNLLDFYDPRNSYLNDVLDRRLGIPLTLSIIYLEVGRRLGLALEGVSFPGHFLVRLGLPDGVLILDPFRRGKSIGAEELILRVRSVQGRELEDRRALLSLLAPASPRSMLERMLVNLKSIYAARADQERALRVAHRLVQLQPSPENVRDRGIFYRAIGAHSAARRDFARYLDERTDPPDAEQLRGYLVELDRQPQRLQ